MVHLFPTKLLRRHHIRALGEEQSDDGIHDTFVLIRVDCNSSTVCGLGKGQRRTKKLGVANVKAEATLI